MIADVVHAQDPRTPIVQNVSTTPILTNMEDVSVTSTGLEKTVPSPQITLESAQEAVMAVVPAQQQKTV